MGIRSYIAKKVAHIKEVIDNFRGANPDDMTRRVEGIEDKAMAKEIKRSSADMAEQAADRFFKDKGYEWTTPSREESKAVKAVIKDAIADVEKTGAFKNKTEFAVAVRQAVRDRLQDPKVRGTFPSTSELIRQPRAEIDKMMDAAGNVAMEKYKDLSVSIRSRGMVTVNQETEKEAQNSRSGNVALGELPSPALGFSKGAPAKGATPA